MPARPLLQPDLDIVAPLLANAFADDPGLRYIIPDDTDWHRISPGFFRYAVSHTLRHGYGLVDHEMRAVSLWDPPEATTPRIDRLSQLMRLAVLLRRNLGRALNVHRYVQGYRPARPHWYLTYIASDPNQRGEGYGSRVLQPMIDYTSAAQIPIYLECSNRNNISFYLRHGFNLIADVPLPDGGRVWPMLREPRAA